MTFVDSFLFSHSGQKLLAALAKMDASRKQVSLKRRLGKGERIEDLLLPTEDSSEDEAETEESRLGDGYTVQKLRKLVKLCRYRERFPALYSLIGALNVYISSLNVHPSQHRKEKHLLVLLGHYCVVNNRDLDAEYIFRNIYSILSSAQELLKASNLRPNSATKMIMAFKTLNSYLVQLTHSDPTYIPNFQASVIQTALVDTYTKINNDATWNTRHESADLRKESTFLPMSVITSFVNSEYVTKTIEAVQNYHAAVNDTDNIPDRMAALRQHENVLLPGKHNAAKLRNILISCGICTVARRSLEFTTVSCGEFLKPAAIKKDMVVMKARRHKVWRKPCFIVLTPALYDVALLYYRYYRPCLTPDSSQESPFFPSASSPSSGGAVSLTTSAIGQCLHKTFILSGGKCRFRFNPRRVRTSFVSTLSAAGCSEDQMLDLAYLMGHQRDTARSSYTVGMMTRKIEQTLTLISAHCKMTETSSSRTAEVIAERIRDITGVEPALLDNQSPFFTPEEQVALLEGDASSDTDEVDEEGLGLNLSPSRSNPSARTVFSPSDSLVTLHDDTSKDDASVITPDNSQPRLLSLPGTHHSDMTHESSAPSSLVTLQDVSSRAETSACTSDTLVTLVDDSSSSVASSAPKSSNTIVTLQDQWEAGSVISTSASTEPYTPTYDKETLQSKVKEALKGRVKSLEGRREQARQREAAEAKDLDVSSEEEVDESDIHPRLDLPRRSRIPRSQINHVRQRCRERLAKSDIQKLRRKQAHPSQFADKLFSSKEVAALGGRSVLRSVMKHLINTRQL